MRVPKLLFLLTVVPLTIFGQTNVIDFTEVESANDWQSAFEKAKTENKLVFVDAYTDWCTYCHKLDKEVYTDPEVISYFNENFINLKFDAETEFGYQLANRFEVDGYPTLLFLTSEQEIFQTIGGFVPAPTLLAYGKQTLESYTLLPELEKKYNDLTITADEQLQYIGLLERSDMTKAQVVAARYINQLISDDYKEIENIWLVSRFENQLHKPPYNFITSHKDSIIAWHGEEEYKDYIKTVYNDNLMLSIKYGDNDLLNRLVTEVLPEFLEPFDLAEGAFATRKLYYGSRKEFSEYALTVRSFLNNNVAPTNRETFLFTNSLEAVNDYEGDTMYQLAAELLQEAVSLNNKNFEATSLLGYTNALLGNFKPALEQLKKARELATDDEERGMVDSLLEAVELMKTN